MRHLILATLIATPALAQDATLPAPDVMAAVGTALLTYQYHCMQGLPAACSQLPQAQIAAIQLVDATWYCATGTSPGACDVAAAAAPLFLTIAADLDATGQAISPKGVDLAAQLGFDPANPSGQAPDLRMTPADQFGPGLAGFTIDRLSVLTDGAASVLAALSP